MFVIFFWKEQMWLSGCCDLWAFVEVQCSVVITPKTWRRTETYTTQWSHTKSISVLMPIYYSIPWECKEQTSDIRVVRQLSTGHKSTLAATFPCKSQDDFITQEFESPATAVTFKYLAPPRGHLQNINCDTKMNEKARLTRLNSILDQMIFIDVNIIYWKQENYTIKKTAY